MSEIDPELIERMAVLVRDLHADHVKHGAHDCVQDFVSRTAAIVAELPVPVDPDLLEARQLVHLRQNAIPGVLEGDWDHGEIVASVVAAIKRGRELQASGK